MVQGPECTILGFPVGGHAATCRSQIQRLVGVGGMLNVNSCCSRGGMQSCSHLVNQGWRHSKDGITFKTYVNAFRQPISENPKRTNGGNLLPFRSLGGAACQFQDGMTSPCQDYGVSFALVQLFQSTPVFDRICKQRKPLRSCW